MYKLIAHRGDKESSKENTLAAFFDAIKKDYVGFECDVRQSKDEKFFVYHNLIYKGKLFKSINSKTFLKDKLPTLENVLSINTDKIIMIEIKDPLCNINKLLKILEKYHDKKIYVISFYEKVLQKLNISKRNYKIGVLNYVLNTNEKHFNYDFICLLNSFVTSDVIDYFAQNKKELFIYQIKKKYIKDLYPYYIVD